MREQKNALNCLLSSPQTPDVLRKGFIRKKRSKGISGSSNMEGWVLNHGGIAVTHLTTKY